jgi:hypothetical protein
MGKIGVLTDIVKSGLTKAEEVAETILNFLRKGEPEKITDEMLDEADDVYLYKNYDLPMDESSRMKRAEEMGFDTDAYHETENDFTAFDVYRGGAGAGDPEMPTGVFTKPTAERIGLGGENEIQMPLKINKGKNLTVKDRNEMAKAINDLDVYGGEYLRARNDFHQFDNEAAKHYNAVFEGEMGKKFLNSDPKKYFEEADKFNDFWDKTLARKGHEARYLLDQTIRDSNFNPIYDSFTVLNDKGSLGRNVKTTVTIDPSNVRSRFARFDPRLSKLKNLLASSAPVAVSLGALSDLKEEPQ